MWCPKKDKPGTSPLPTVLPDVGPTQPEHIVLTLLGKLPLVLPKKLLNTCPPHSRTTGKGQGRETLVRGEGAVCPPSQDANPRTEPWIHASLVCGWVEVPGFRLGLDLHEYLHSLSLQ